MSQHYSDVNRETDPHALPDIEVFQLTPEEEALQNEDLMREAVRTFPLATMNSRDRERAIQWAVGRGCCTGGWFYHFCFPGCLPDSEPNGPYATRGEALTAAREASGAEGDADVALAGAVARLDEAATAIETAAGATEATEATERGFLWMLM